MPSERDYIDAMLHTDDPEVQAELAAMYIDGVGDDEDEEETPKAAEIRKRMMADALRQIRKARVRV